MSFWYVLCVLASARVFLYHVVLTLVPGVPSLYILRPLDEAVYTAWDHYLGYHRWVLSYPRPLTHAETRIRACSKRDHDPVSLLY